MTFTAALLRRLLLPGLFGLSLTLAGCGIGTVTTETAGPLAISGGVHGGLQPITGAAIQLFAVSTGGNGTLATSLLAQPVVTDSHSYFSLTGDYSCPSSDAQVYLVARGGNPGYSSNVNNPALVLLSALGNCGNLLANPNRFLAVNEVTTVAAVYALAPFMAAYDHVGASSTNTTGIANAFLNAQLLADTSTGMAPQLPANLSSESNKLYALADAIVPCVNSTGSSAACSPLFTAATVNGVAPTDVLGALLNIVKHPGSNVSGVFNAISSTPPYATTLTRAPHDWSMTITVKGGGLNSPTTVALDKFGNAWVANYGDTQASSGVVAFSPQGTPFAGSPFGVGVQTEAYSMALDKNGDVWVPSKEAHNSAGGTGSIAKFAGASSSSAPGALINIFSDASLYYPQAIATDPNGSGSVIIANFPRGTATIYDLNGSYLRNLGQGYSSYPIGVTSDNAGGVWFADQGGSSLTHAFANGTVQVVNCCYAAQSVKLDLHSNAWATNFTAVGRSSNSKFTFSEVSPSGTVLINEGSGGGLSSPGGAAVDAGGQFWAANFNGASITEIAGNDTTVTAGTALSPSGFGQDAGLYQPFSITPDQSGNIWVANQAANSLTMFVGLATPTAMPATPVPQQP